MLSAHHLSILQMRLLPLPPSNWKANGPEKEERHKPTWSDGLGRPDWQPLNFSNLEASEPRPTYRPLASLTDKVYYRTLPQSGKGLKPPSSNFLKQPTGKSGGHGCCDYTPPLSTTQYNTALYKFKVNTLTNTKYIRFASLFNCAILGPFCLKHLAKYRSTATLSYRRRLSGVVDKGLL